MDCADHLLFVCVRVTSVVCACACSDVRGGRAVPHERREAAGLQEAPERRAGQLALPRREHRLEPGQHRRCFPRSPCCTYHSVVVAGLAFLRRCVCVGRVCTTCVLLACNVHVYGSEQMR